LEAFYNPSVKRLAKAFLKTEAGPPGDPRNITSMDATYLAKLGPFISAIEHLFVKVPFAVKGITLHQRDIRMQPMLKYEYYFDSDFSRMDKTIDVASLKEFEFEIYNRIIHPAYRSELKKLTSVQLRTFVRHMMGYHYFIHGQRLSGVANTSMGNMLINRGLMLYIFDHLEIPFVGFCEGDDGCGGFSYEGDIAYVKSEAERLADLFGYKLEFNISRSLSTVGFCGRHLVDSFGEIVSHCDVLRTISKFHITTARRVSTSTELKSLLVAKAMAYHSTDNHTPIVGELCRLVLRVFPDVAPKWDQDMSWRAKLGEERTRTVDRSALEVSVATHVGCGLQFLRDYCQYLDALTCWPESFVPICNEGAYKANCHDF